MDTLSTPIPNLQVPKPFNPNNHHHHHHLKPTSFPHHQLPSSAAKATATSSFSTLQQKDNFTPLFTSYNPQRRTSFSSLSSLKVSPPRASIHHRAASGYAAALLDITQCNGTVLRVEKDVRRLLKLMFKSKNEQITEFMRNEKVEEKVKGEVMKELMEKGKFEEDLMKLVKMLVDKRQSVELVKEVLEEFIRVFHQLTYGYARCGNMEEAEKLFRLIRNKNVVSWTTMISGYSQNGKYVDALDTFLAMEKDHGVEPNEVSVASVLPACANLGALELGERIERYARRKGYTSNLFVSNALLEMYSKCGKLDRAMQLFDEIHERKNLCSWNSMIMGYAIHGRHEAALHLFHLMLKEGMEPDSITFVAAIMACTHGAKVAKGRELFELMKDKFGIVPKLEHYGCMVDLLGRKGKLNEAYDLIQTMPMKPDSVIWGTLLGACSFHSNIEVAEKVAEALFELEPWNPGNYVILSNIYASVKRWDGVAKLRKMMKGSQISKAAGYSCLEEAGRIHMFVVEDKSHSRTNEIYAALEDVYCKIMENNSRDEIDLDVR